MKDHRFQAYTRLLVAAFAGIGVGLILIIGIAALVYALVGGLVASIG